MIGVETGVYIINIDYSLTPKTFYTEFLRGLQKYFRNIIDMGNMPLYLDFSNCRLIEGHVIPNLFVTGYIVKNNVGYRPILYIPLKNKVSSFLKSMGFYDINDNTNVFELYEDWGKIENIYNLDDSCTVSFFNRTLDEIQIAEYFTKKYTKLFSTRLKDFSYTIYRKDEQKTISFNSLEVFCKQICYNSILHGRSFCYASVQVLSKKQVLISLSDCGKGMLTTFFEKIKGEKYIPVILKSDCSLPKTQLDLLAILEGMVYRFDEEIYGIWSVLLDILSIKGIMRVHSGKIRLTFDNIEADTLATCKTKRDAALMLYDYIMNNKDVKEETPNYGGTHIEIELPIG